MLEPESRARLPADEPAGLWCDRDFRLLWLGETTSTVGTNISRVALPLVAVVTVHASTLQVSALTAATWLPWLVVGLPAGAWVDRLPRRLVMLVCDVASLLLLLSVPVAAWSGALTFGHLLAVALLTGTASVFFTTAYSVYVPSIVAPELVPEANAKLQGSEAIAQVAGPGLAGLLAQLAGAVAGLVVDALSFLVSAVCLLRIARREQPAVAARTTGLRQEIAIGVRLVAADPYLRVLAVFGALTNLTLVGYQSILVVFLVRDVHVSSAGVGALLGLMGAGGVLGAVVAPGLARRIGGARALLLSAVCSAPFGLLIPLTGSGPRLALVAIGGFVVGAGAVSGNVIKDSWRQVYCPRHLLGRVLVSMQVLNYGAIPLGALLAGHSAARSGCAPRSGCSPSDLPWPRSHCSSGPLHAAATSQLAERRTSTLSFRKPNGMRDAVTLPTASGRSRPSRGGGLGVGRGRCPASDRRCACTAWPHRTARSPPAGACAASARCA